jgi:multidrug efflux pump subunit AcrB
MLWAKGSTKKLFGVGIVALIIGFGFIGTGGYLFSKVTFNIFPPAKDTNQLITTITYEPNTNIDQAQHIAGQVDKIVADTTNDNFVQASYYGQADVKSATLTIDLTHYQDREATAPQIIKLLNAKFHNFDAAQVKAASLDAGPPAAAFSIQIESTKNRDASVKLANDIAAYLKDDAQLKRPDGSVAKFDTVEVGNSSIFNRNDGKQYVDVTATFVDTDTSTLVTLAKDSVKKEFPQSKVESYGLAKTAISFDAGQEDENQDSFNTLAIAFPALLVVIYIVLAFQFRSMLQPLLIFMAIPFSLFGITAGLYYTDNPFSFFAMLGFFALIGLSIKNTILLTDYANQSRAAGMGSVDAAHEALAERFRPLIATSLTATVSLIPLALSSPFWEGLSVVLIFGLLSSTFLVITVFPYYYLGSEYLRHRVNRRTAISWLILAIVLVVLLSKAGPVAILAPVLAAGVVKLVKRLSGRLRRTT